MRETICHTDIKTRKIIVFYIKVIWFLDRKWEGKILLLFEDKKTVWTFISTANTSDINRTERIWCYRIWTVVTGHKVTYRF